MECQVDGSTSSEAPPSALPPPLCFCGPVCGGMGSWVQGSGFWRATTSSKTQPLDHVAGQGGVAVVSFLGFVRVRVMTVMTVMMVTVTVTARHPYWPVSIITTSCKCTTGGRAGGHLGKGWPSSASQYSVQFSGFQLFITQRKKWYFPVFWLSLSLGWHILCLFVSDDRGAPAEASN